ncbi:MAG: hypothetical protein QME47_07115 [Candidatus Thermoplasmatota archaeon]|nr:hypothetical protein [Candidatus Thermoplasmatota archaeon]
MSEIVQLAFDRNGVNGFRHRTGKAQWTVTFAVTEAIFDFIETYPGPFQADTTAIIALNRIKNVGVPGTVYARFAELNADGTEISACQREYSNVSTDGTLGFDIFQEYDTIRMCELRTVDPTGGQVISTRKGIGTYYFGVKTWGTGETEPSWEAFTAISPALLVSPAYAAEISPEASPLKWVLAIASGVGVAFATYIGAKAMHKRS